MCILLIIFNDIPNYMINIQFFYLCETLDENNINQIISICKNLNGYLHVVYKVKKINIVHPKINFIHIKKNYNTTRFCFQKWQWAHEYVMANDIQYCCFLDTNFILLHPIQDIIGLISSHINENTYFNFSTNTMIVKNDIFICSKLIIHELKKFIDVLSKMNTNMLQLWAEYYSAEMKKKHNITITVNFIEEYIFGDFLANHSFTWFLPFNNFIIKNKIKNIDLFTFLLERQYYFDICIPNIINSFIYLDDNVIKLEITDNQYISQYSNSEKFILVNLNNSQTCKLINNENIRKYLHHIKKIQISNLVDNSKFNSTTDIFIKTCDKDFYKLELLLHSIYIYVSGYRKIILVVDETTDAHKLTLTKILKNFKFNIDVCFVNIPNYSVSLPGGTGYTYQQIVKLEWFKYTDADCVIIVDSDCVFSNYCTVMDFFIYNKKDWFYRNWEHANEAIKWKPITDKINLRDDTFETMLLLDFVFFKNDSIKFLEYIKSTFNVSSYNELFFERESEFGFLSEFNIYGNWCMKNSDNYIFINSSDHNLQPLFTNKLHNLKLMQLQNISKSTNYDLIKYKVLSSQYSFSEYIINKT